jgi:hypothetical protein
LLSQAFTKTTQTLKKRIISCQSMYVRNSMRAKPSALYVGSDNFTSKQTDCVFGSKN